MEPKPNISADIIADSINTGGQRITSFILKYPRFIHSEFMTHRVFSRNAASSRAIPVQRMIDNVVEDPAMPEWWGATQKGMQANEQLDQPTIDECLHMWKMQRDLSVATVYQLMEHGMHKQLANRLLEPWSHITVLATATCYDNFFFLRAHPDAQPEFQVLAYRALEKYLNGTPKLLAEGEWHAPFGDRTEGLDEKSVLKVATARAARLSYDNFDGEIDLAKDIALHDRLAESGHWSPFEHCAQARASIRQSNNFKGGWLQYRAMFPNENRTEIDLYAILAAKPEWVTL